MTHAEIIARLRTHLPLGVDTYNPDGKLHTMEIGTRTIEFVHLPQTLRITVVKKNNTGDPFHPYEYLVERAVAIRVDSKPETINNHIRTVLRTFYPGYLNYMLGSFEK